MQRAVKYKKLWAIALLASAMVAAPLAIKAYALEDNSQAEQQTPLPVVEEPELQVKTVVQTPPLAPPVQQPAVPVEDDEQQVPADQRQVDPVAVDLAAAIGIAQAEHPGVEVLRAQVKLKMLDEHKVFKIVFADGWRIYVRASDGEIVRIKDAANKKHDCSKRGQQAVNAWRAMQAKKWGNYPHHKKDHRKPVQPPQQPIDPQQSTQQ